MTDQTTVLVTGASGFIAKHIVVRLLNAGYRVVGSVRSLDRTPEIVDAVTPQLETTEAPGDRLRFVALDLTVDDGWAEALAGVEVLMHTASPFPMSQPKDRAEVIGPAVDGTLRALRAAREAGIRRVVLTSSVAAVAHTGGPPGPGGYSEADWTDPEAPTATAYVASKALAERAAWDFVVREAPEIALTAINPGLVLGPPLDARYGTSVRLVERVLRATDPLLPRFGYACVDVRDVAEMHLRVLTADGAAGKRFVAADRFLWFHEMAEILKAAYPDRKIVTRRAPNLLVRGLALFDRSVRTIVPTLGRREDVSNARAREVLGMEFIDAAKSLRATAAFLIGRKIV